MSAKVCTQSKQVFANIMLPKGKFVENSKDMKKSTMSTFFKLLLKVSLIPLTLNTSSNQLKFKMFSKPTLLFNLYILITYGINFLCLYAIIGVDKIKEFWTNMCNQSEKTDFLTYAAYIIIYGFGNSTLKTFKDITKISNDLLLHQNLVWPERGGLLIFMSLIGNIAIITWAVLTFNARVTNNPNMLIGTIISLSSLYTFTIFTHFVLEIFFRSWMETFAMICDDMQPNFGIIQHTQKCFKIYKSIQDGIGEALLGLFMVGQILIVISLYNCISTAAYQPYDTLTNIAVSICYAIIAMYNSFVIYGQTLSAEKAFTGIRKFVEPLREALIGETAFTISSV